MLESLHVKNVALIDETEVQFREGLNIITGETGAGKSLIIGSILLALGAKADKGLIRNGEEYALVELMFSVTKEQEKRLKEIDIFPEDGMVCLQRRVMPAKSVCRINGEMVGGSSLKDAATILLDIHGQHDNQTLLKKQKQFALLDQFCGEKIDALLAGIKQEYANYQSLLKKLEEASHLESNKEREIALAQFECQEIEQAMLKPGEDEELETVFLKMENARKLLEAVGNARALIGALDHENAQTLIERAIREIANVRSYDEELDVVDSNLQAAADLLSDVNHVLERYLDQMEFAGEEYLQVRERLDCINNLKQKYGNTIEEILEYKHNQAEMLEKYSDIEAYVARLSQESERARQTLLDQSYALSKIRKEQAKVLSEQMKTALLDLNFLDVVFEIKVEEDAEKLTATGINEVEFMISLNPGEAVKPLSMIASGGELSRIMLAIKTVYASQDDVQTLIFDEIDAGISGKTAWKVSEKLALLGKEHQVICITHLPQIAAMADHHIKISKMVKDQVTTTKLEVLEEQSALEEIARLLGSDEITAAALENAKELKTLANQSKK